MTYADEFNLRDKALCKINDIADAVDGLLIQATQENEISSQIIASTSFTAMTGMSKAMTVAAGELVLMILDFNGVVATVNDQPIIQLLRDAVELRIQPLVARTATEENIFCLHYLDDPGAGTYTYSAKLKNNTGARNITTQYRFLQLVKFQNT